MQENKPTVVAWAREHLDIWDIVSGIRCTSIEHNCTVYRLLQEAGLDELSEMMALRIYQLMIDGEPVIGRPEPPL